MGGRSVFKLHRYSSTRAAELCGILGTPVDAPVAPYRGDAWVSTGKYSEVMRGCIFKPGDVIWDEGPAGPVKALVLHVGAEWREHLGDNISRLRVARLTKKGTWSGAFHATYPGHVERAYEQAAKMT